MANKKDSNKNTEFSLEEDSDLEESIIDDLDDEEDIFSSDDEDDLSSFSLDDEEEDDVILSTDNSSAGGSDAIVPFGNQDRDVYIHMSMDEDDTEDDILLTDDSSTDSEMGVDSWDGADDHTHEDDVFLENSASDGNLQEKGSRANLPGTLSVEEKVARIVNKKKSKLPLFIGVAVAVTAVAGGGAYMVTSDQMGGVQTSEVMQPVQEVVDSSQVSAPQAEIPETLGEANVSQPVLPQEDELKQPDLEELSPEPELEPAENNGAVLTPLPELDDLSNTEALPSLETDFSETFNNQDDMAVSSDDSEAKIAAQTGEERESDYLQPDMGMPDVENPPLPLPEDIGAQAPDAPEDITLDENKFSEETEKTFAEPLDALSQTEIQEESKEPEVVAIPEAEEQVMDENPPALTEKDPFADLETEETKEATQDAMQETPPVGAADVPVIVETPPAEVMEDVAEEKASEPEEALPVVAPAPVVAQPPKISAPVEPAKVEAVVVKPESKISTKAAVKPKPKSWSLKAAQPGSATIYEKNSQEIRNIEIGDVVPGIGRVTVIDKINGKWQVVGTGGRISQ